MIPKVIHYCWFGRNPLPELTIECIESWKKYCSDFEIKLWNEDNFNFEENQFAREAYQEKKWAFVSDYVRLKILYEEGGIYMDTDVKVLKPLESLLQHNAFSGFENNQFISTAIMGSERKNPWIGYLLSYYEEKSFYKTDGSLNNETNVKIITRMTRERYPVCLDNSYQEFPDFVLYPKDYFCPLDNRTGKLTITDNSYTIHLFDGSWLGGLEKESMERAKVLNRTFGTFIGNALNSIIYNYKKNGIMGVLKKIKGRGL